MSRRTGSTKRSGKDKLTVTVVLEETEQVTKGAIFQFSTYLYTRDNFVWNVKFRARIFMFI